MRDLCLENFKARIEPRIYHEAECQLAKWGVQEHDWPTWLAILGEEVGELNGAMLEWVFGKGSAEAVTEEAIQVATLAVKIAEMSDAEQVEAGR